MYLVPVDLVNLARILDLLQRRQQRSSSPKQVKPITADRVSRVSRSCSGHAGQRFQPPTSLLNGSAKSILLAVASVIEGSIAAWHITLMLVPGLPLIQSRDDEKLCHPTRTRGLAEPFPFLSGNSFMDRFGFRHRDTGAGAKVTTLPRPLSR